MNKILVALTLSFLLPVSLASAQNHAMCVANSKRTAERKAASAARKCTNLTAIAARADSMAKIIEAQTKLPLSAKRLASAKNRHTRALAKLKTRQDKAAAACSVVESAKRLVSSAGSDCPADPPKIQSTPSGTGNTNNTIPGTSSNNNVTDVGDFKDNDNSYEDDFNPDNLKNPNYSDEKITNFLPY